MNDCICEHMAKAHRALRTKRTRPVRKMGGWIALCAMAVTGCSRASTLVPKGPHRPAVEPPPEVVSAPPPPARIEVVPLQRNPACLYLDGHFEPMGQSWTWQSGRWVLAPNGCYYAPPETHYERTKSGTTLVYRAGIWLGRNKRTCAEPEPCPDPGAFEP